MTVGSLRDYLFHEEPGVTLYCGDCRDVLPLLSPKSVDLLLTDPPFSVPIKYQDAEGTYPRSWGDLVVMEPFFAEVFRELRAVVKDTGQTYIHCDGDSYPVVIARPSVVCVSIYREDHTYTYPYQVLFSPHEQRVK